MDNNFNLQNNYNSNDVMPMTNFDCLPQTDPTIRSKIDRMAGAAFGKALTSVILVWSSFLFLYIILYGVMALNIYTMWFGSGLLLIALFIFLICSVVSVVLGCVAIRQAKKADELAVAYGMRAGGKNIAAKVLGRIGKFTGITFLAVLILSILVAFIIPEGGIGG